MSRINTNVSSLIAQNRLTRSNNDLQQALGRLSTGLRINSGKDDPAGLIASENLRRDITAIDKAISNSERAGLLIATADSSLGQVSKLLNDVRGLVSEAANSGVLSAEQIAANQLQIDSSLEAIDRIAQNTTFQGRKILDGSLDFLLKEGTGFKTVSDLKIDQANLGATGSLSVNVAVSAAATRARIANSIPTAASAQITLDGQLFTLQTKASSGVNAFSVDLQQNSGAEATGVVTIDGHDFEITAASGQTGIDDVTVTVARTDNTAEGTVTIDQTDFAIAADAGTKFNNVSVEIAKSDLGRAKNQAGTVRLGDGTNNVEFDIEVAGGFANLSDRTGITIDITHNAAADSANYDTATNTLQINFNSGVTTARTGAAVKTLLENATIDNNAVVGTPFTITNETQAGSYDGTNDTVTNGTLTQNEAGATLNTSTNKLVVTLNSNADATVTSSGIDAAISALADFNAGAGSVVATGSTNINVASVSTGAIGTLTRQSVKAGYADGSPDTLTLSFDQEQSQISINDVIAAIDGLAEFTGTTSTSSTGTINGTNASIASNNVAALKRLTNGVAANYSAATNTLKLIFDGSDSSVTNAAVIAAINGANGGTIFENTSAAESAGTIDATSLQSANDLATGGQIQDLVVRIAGKFGSEVFTFQAGTTFDQIANAIQLVSDATGVTANVNGSSLELNSTEFGSEAFVDVEVISEGAGGGFEANLSASRASGTDVQARVNGVEANARGNTLSVNTSTLDLTLTLETGSSTDVNFTITGGGAVFQLGPDVVSNQQAQIGIGSIATGKLGGVSGRLYELRSGNAKALDTDATGAQRIIDEVITKVVELRGRLGAFQRTTIESNIASLQDTLTNLTEAESSIRDADFARESAALTRAQILVQSGTSVLALANQNPQNALALLR